MGVVWAGECDSVQSSASYARRLFHDFHPIATPALWLLGKRLPRDETCRLMSRAGLEDSYNGIASDAKEVSGLVLYGDRDWLRVRALREDPHTLDKYGDPRIEVTARTFDVTRARRTE